MSDAPEHDPKQYRMNWVAAQKLNVNNNDDSKRQRIMCLITFVNLIQFDPHDGQQWNDKFTNIIVWVYKAQNYYLIHYGELHITKRVPMNGYIINRNILSKKHI